MRSPSRPTPWAGLAAVLLLTAPGPAAAAQTVLSAQLGLVPWKAAGNVTNVAPRLAFEKFLAAHPEVDVHEFERLWLPGQHWGAAQVMSLAANAGPDLFRLGFDELAGYVREGLIQPVDEDVENWEERARWPDSLTADLKLEGHDWGLVFDAEIAHLAGSREALPGLTDRALPRSLDQLAAFAARSAVPGKRAGFGITEGASLVAWWLTLARDAGVEPCRPGGEGLVVDLASDGARRAAAALAGLGTALAGAAPATLLVADSDKTLRHAFAKGQVATAVISEGDLDAGMWGDAAEFRDNDPLQPHQPVLAPVPGFSPDRPLSWYAAGTIAVIPSYLRGARRSLAFAFHAEATGCGTAVETEWLAALVRQGGRMPSSWCARYPADPAAKVLPAHWATVMRAARDHARPLPPDPEYAALVAILGPGLKGLLLGTGDPATVLAAAQREFDETVHQKTRRTGTAGNAIGWAVLAVFAGALLYGLWRLVAALRDEMVLYRNAPMTGMNAARWRFVLALFAPAAALAVCFGVVPLVLGFKMSLFTHVLRHGGDFAGARNFLDVIVNPLTALVLRNTVLYIGLSFMFGFIAPLVLAIVLSSFPVGKLIVRSAFFLPAVASAVVIAILWQQMFDPGGPFNQLAAFLGVAPRSWLKEPATALFAVTLPGAWATLGVAGLTYLAGLSAVPESLYEEAELSGAGLADRFRHVTLPHLAPLIGINAVGWLITSVRTAEQVFLLTGGGPGRATYIVGLDIFNQAYVGIRFGYAMAEVWLLVAVILVFSIYQMRAVRTGQLRVAGE